MSAEPSLVQACQRCWRRKQKCGRQRPKCAECAQASADCVPRIWGHVLDGDKDRFTNNAVSIRSGIEHLKARIAQLESQQTIPNAENSGPSPSTFQSHGWASREDRTAPAGTANEVDYLSVAAMGEPEKRDAFNHGPSFITMVEGVTRLSALCNPALKPSEAGDDTTATNLDAICEDLRKSSGYGLRRFADIYRHSLDQILPCILPSAWIEVLELATSIDQGSATGTRGEPVSELLLCFAACLGALSTSGYPAAQKSVRRLAQRCSWQLPVALVDASDVETVCCLLLAALLSLYMFDAASSWNFAGLALTKALSSGFHRAVDASEQDAATSTIFWSVYTLDRAFAIVLDRPLSVEDGDMTIRLPLATPLPQNGQADVQLQFLATWTIHYSHMISDWQRTLAADDDLNTCLESLAYWRDTCREAQQSDRVAVNEGSGSNLVHLLIKATESNLTCRALVQLFSRANSGRVADGIRSRCQTELEVEIPRFLTAYKAALDASMLGPNILDVWTIFGATIAFIVSCQSSLARSVGDSAPPAFGVGVATMKVVSSCVDILRAIGLRYDAVYDLQDVLWAFLSALENCRQSRSQPRDEPSDKNALHSSISQCRLTIPHHLAEMMNQALNPPYFRPYTS